MILVLDGHNLFHRARSGFQLGDHAIVFNFVRQLRALVEQFKPTRVYLTLEGAPKRQLALLPEYKANRAIDPNDAKKVAEHASFQRQKQLIVDMLVQHFPISVIRHPDFEADDVIHNVIRRSSTAVDFTVVSTDTDFIQLLQEFKHVRLYNPVTKAFVEAPTHDYVLWKALRGDASDNVPGLVSDAEAARLADDFEALNESPLSISPEFSRNLALIDFAEWSDEEAVLMTSSSPVRDWDAVKALFEAWVFRSLLKEGTWDKFVATFDPLFGT